MNQQQIVDGIAARMGISKVQADTFLKEFVTLTTSAVKRGEHVKLKGFGTFEKRKRKARPGRNPQNGMAIKIPAAWTPKFRPSDIFRAEVAGS